MAIDDTDPRTRALLDAILGNDVERVRAALGGGANPNAVTDREVPIGDLTSEVAPMLVVAAAAGYVEVVRALLDAGARIDEQAEREFFFHNDNGTWGAVGDAITAASSAGHFDVVALLVQRGARLTDAALLRALKEQQREVVRLLLECGVDPGTKTSAPLCIAVRRDEIALVKLLIDRGARVDVTEETTPSALPLHYALLYGRVSIARLLVERGAALPEERWLAGLTREARQGVDATLAALAR